jgi:hypothetical protein
MHDKRWYLRKILSHRPRGWRIISRGSQLSMSKGKKNAKVDELAKAAARKIALPLDVFS